jgi:ABC-type molybdate transport system ATPase subunit
MHQELKENFTKLTTEVKNLKIMSKQDESHSLQEMENMQDQIEVLKLVNSAVKSAANQSTSVSNTEDVTTQGVQFPTVIHTQNYSLLRIALGKQIDEVKPYFGKKQENIDSRIRKIDKVVEFARIPDDEVFTLAKLKLQGDAEK